MTKHYHDIPKGNFDQVASPNLPLCNLQVQGEKKVIFQNDYGGVIYIISLFFMHMFLSSISLYRWNYL